LNLGILKDLVILLAVAVFIISVSRKIKLPPVVGFLLTGILIGPGGLSLVRDMNPRLFIFVLTRYASEIDELTKLGANDVIPEEFETSLEIFARVLEKYHVPRNIIDAQIKMLRGECYGMLRGTYEAIRPNVERIADLLAAGTADTFYVAKAA
jgi:CPA2 family monovalent cation:H+ antiporter-2